ncbi:alpha/beta hydrolase family protein [Thermomonas carbonis]|uniref:Acyl-peptide hydrolase n=1 Tax=Thermomonas carbonis TaxID=1463158 RepID=A0A7G9ST48_9GAMM|nr:S9 family peptidase [Thermomonas carbonis]QNN71023.1 S9 family peptidase [Thermomonas carbonis]GHC04010.1 peptidase S9 [Thermomonas carbonis]
MPSADRISLALALLLATAPTLAADAPADPALEARIAAMGKVGGASAAQYSPDGKHIAYITTLSGSPQAWIIPAQGGYPRQVTNGSDAVSGLRWSPDGKLAYAVSPGGGYNAQLFLTTANGVQMTRINEGDANTFPGDFAPDGRYYFRSNARSPDSTDTWLYDPATGKAKLAVEMETVGNIDDMRGHLAVVNRLVTRGNNNLWLEDLRTHRGMLLTPHQGSAQSSGLFGSDSNTVYIAHNIDRDRMALARVDISTDGRTFKRSELAARDDAELDDFILDDAKTHALLTWNVAGRNELELLDLASNTRRRLPAAPAELVGGTDFSPDGKRVVMALSGSVAPSDLWQLDLASGTYTRLTYSPSAGVDLTQLVTPTLRTFKAHDGLELSGWLYLPKDVKAPGPVVLSFHGGPEGQERPAFRAEYQALLASGIAVFAPNIRGSSGFGKKFMSMDNHAGRFDANKDIKAAADFLIAERIGAKGRLGIVGGSYGGYVVMVAVTDYPDTFAAGANLFGMVNFETFFAQSTPWMGAISTGEYGDPETQLQLLRDLSPIHKLDRVKTPLLVMHGANDTNVPVVEAEQVVAALKKRGVPVEYLLFPDEGHGWRKQANRVTSTATLAAFFAKHLK